MAKRSNKFYWTVAVTSLCVIAIVAIISLFLLVNSGLTIQDKDQQIQSFMVKEKNWENTKAELAKLSEKNAELEKKNENLKAEAEEFKQERNNALNKAQIAKKYGKDMEELALSHAAKFQKLRIENDKLSEELIRTKINLKGYKDLAQKLEKQSNLYLEMIKKRAKAIEKTKK